MTDDITLPVRRTTGETLQDRLTANAYHNILPSRYKKEGEDVEDIFERVAKNIAVAEAVYADEDIQIDTYHIKPDHPRRSELFHEVLNGYEDARVPLTEENAKWVSYDRLMSDDDISAATHDRLMHAKKSFQNAMEHLKFMPNSPTIMNAGAELQQLSACFVNSPEDDMNAIYDTLRESALVMQSGGGMGYAFSYLRPYGDRVGSSGGIASGPITFMRSYDQMTGTIAQGGTRRGAQMGIMRCTHPDLPYFIHAKRKDVSLAQTLKLNDPDDYTYTSFSEALEEARGLIDEEGRVPQHLRNAVEGHLSNFNISVAVTDEFMEAVKAGEEFTMINPRTGNAHVATEETKELYEWFDMGECVTVGEELTVPAEELFSRMVDGAYENGEPGIIFIDRCNQDHSFPVESTPTWDNSEHEIHATNPCGEQPLQEMEACNLGHINLSTIVDEDAPDWRDYRAKHFNEELFEAVDTFLNRAIDWQELDDRISLGTRFLDNVVTMSAFPIGEIEKTVRDNRKIGLGIMGLAQMYIQMGVQYGSEAANEIGRVVMRYINQKSKGVSHELAEERGAFTNWEDSKYNSPMNYPGWFRRQTGKQPAEWSQGYPLRNHNTTTIAPTGTTSMLGNTSGGCEPIYNVAYYKNVSDDVQGDEMLVEFDDYFLDVLRANGIDVDEVKEEAMTQMSSNSFDGIDGLSTVPDAIGELFVTTDDLSGREHASVQCALQEGVDSAISKTCNFPNSATKEDVKEVLVYLYENGGKGGTLYRDGTRSKQVLTTRADNTEFAGDVEDMPQEEAEEMVADLITEFDIEVVPPKEDHWEIIEPSEDWDEDTMQQFVESVGDMDPAEVTEAPQYAEKRERPDTLDSRTQRIETGYGSLYVTISEDRQGRPFELFTNIGNNGSTVASFTEAIAKVISISLRSGTDPEDLSDTLQGIKSPKVAWDDGRQIHSIPDAIGVAMERWMEERIEVGDRSYHAPPLDELQSAPAEEYYDEEPAPEEWMEEGDEPFEGETPPFPDEMEDDGQVKTSKCTKEDLLKQEDLDEMVADGQGRGAAGCSGDECPECHQMTLMNSEGCQSCLTCGFSKC